VAVSAPFARLRSSEGTEQLGKRLLHLIGRHRHPRLQQPLRGRCVNGAYQALLEFLHNRLLGMDDVGEAEEAPGRASSGVQSTSTVTFMMRFLFAAHPAIGGQDREMGRSPALPKWPERTNRAESTDETVQSLGVITSHFETDDVPIAPRRRNPC
jgi:hypothetical protein